MHPVQNGPILLHLFAVPGSITAVIYFNHRFFCFSNSSALVHDYFIMSFSVNTQTKSFCAEVATLAVAIVRKRFFKCNGFRFVFMHFI